MNKRETLGCSSACAVVTLGKNFHFVVSVAVFQYSTPAWREFTSLNRTEQL